MVCGSLNVDLIAEVSALPRPGETVVSSQLRTLPGGKGANQAYAAAVSQGGAGSVVMVGRVGADAHGEFLRSELEQAGVDVAHVTVVTAPTGTALITVDQAGENTIVIASGANASWNPAADLGDLAFSPDDVVLLQHEIPDAAVEAVVTAAGAALSRIVLNAAPARTISRALADRVDVLLLNEGEASEVLGLTDFSLPAITRARESLRCSLIITRGERGVVVASSSGLTRRLAAHAIEPVDTVGAGDAFAGVLAARLSAGDDIFDAAAAGNAAAALTCSVVGARHPSLDYRAVLATGAV